MPTAPTDPRTTRRRAKPARLLAQAAGSPRTWPGKLARLLKGLWSYLDRRALDRRLTRLHARGHIEQVPTRLQLLVGSRDMVRFWISPNSADYYQHMGISYWFHQLLRLLDEPLSLTDPVGFLSSRDAIVGHLMQVVHANPLYDLQLLDMYDDGLDQLCEQLEQMLAGTHPRAGSIGAIVEEPDYHTRLLAFVRAWREDPDVSPLLRDNVAASDHWRALERTFGSLTGSMRYFCRLPASLPKALRHLVSVRAFRPDLAA